MSFGRWGQDVQLLSRSAISLSVCFLFVLSGGIHSDSSSHSDAHFVLTLARLPFS